MRLFGVEIIAAPMIEEAEEPAMTNRETTTIESDCRKTSEAAALMSNRETTTIESGRECTGRNYRETSESGLTSNAEAILRTRSDSFPDELIRSTGRSNYERIRRDRSESPPNERSPTRARLESPPHERSRARSESESPPPPHHDDSSKSSSKGTPWSEDEHRNFLVGLKELGKGDWKGIASKYVPSRTPTQVASHAQKYYNRISMKRKRRSSVFDLTLNQQFGDDESSNDDEPSQPANKAAPMVHPPLSQLPLSQLPIFIQKQGNPGDTVIPSVAWVPILNYSTDGQSLLIPTDDGQKSLLIPTSDGQKGLLIPTFVPQSSQSSFPMTTNNDTMMNTEKSKKDPP